MNWTRTIDLAKKRGYFTHREKVASSEWNRCAVGSLMTTKAIKVVVQFDNWSGPLDPKLYEWGNKFDTEVYRDNFSTTRALQKKIQARITKLTSKKV